MRLGDQMLDRKWRLFTIVVLLSLGWYLFFALLDRATVSQMTTVSGICLNEYLPPGTIHSPEGHPFLPAGEYTFMPLGIDCTFTMADGSTQRSFHPRYGATLIAGVPILMSLLWGVWQFISFARTSSEHANGRGREPSR
jgi:hypothetical protein